MSTRTTSIYRANPNKGE